MKTTVNLSDALLLEAKSLALRQGVTLREVFENALRAHVLDSPEPDSPKFRLQLPTVRGHGPPRLDIRDRQALYDSMEER